MRNIVTCVRFSTTQNMYLHDDVVDRYVYKFNEEPDKTHYAKPYGCGDCDFLKLCKNVIELIKRQLNGQQ